MDKYGIYFLKLAIHLVKYIFLSYQLDLESISAADYIAYMTNFLHGECHIFRKFFQDNYPLVKAHFHKVQNIPEIKAYLETRPPSPFGA